MRKAFIALILGAVMAAHPAAAQAPEGAVRIGVLND